MSIHATYAFPCMYASAHMCVHAFMQVCTCMCRCMFVRLYVCPDARVKAIAYLHTRECRCALMCECECAQMLMSIYVCADATAYVLFSMQALDLAARALQLLSVVPNSSKASRYLDVCMHSRTIQYIPVSEAYACTCERFNQFLYMALAVSKCTCLNLCVTRSVYQSAHACTHEPASLHVNLHMHAHASASVGVDTSTHIGSVCAHIYTLMLRKCTLDAQDCVA